MRIARKVHHRYLMWLAIALAAAGGSGATVAPAASGPIAITGVTVIDGTGAPPKSGMTVTIADGRIRSIVRDAAKPIVGVQVIDGRGKFLLPGFIDSNVHATVYGNPNRRDTSAKYSDRNEELATEFAQRHLKAGVTTIRDSYGLLPPLIAVRDRIARGDVVGPRLLVAGNIVGWGGPFSLTFSLSKESDLSLFQEKWNDLVAQGVGEDLVDMTPEELRVAIRAYLDKGVDFIKYGGTSHNARPSLIGFSPRAQAVIVEEAHRRGRKVDTHATTPEGLRLAVEAGTDVIQHPELNSRDLPDDLIALIVKHHALCAMRANMVTGELRKEQVRRRTAAEEIQRRNAERLVRGGCTVTIATDNYLGDAPEFRREPKPPEQEPGEGSLRAIEGLVELGMTPMQAIVAATRNGAEAAGMARELGTIEPGKIADLILLDRDPLADIHAIRALDRVIAGGRLVDLAVLPDHALFGAAAAPTDRK